MGAGSVAVVVFWVGFAASGAGVTQRQTLGALGLWTDAAAEGLSWFTGGAVSPAIITKAQPMWLVMCIELVGIAGPVAM
jgi:hypothetical protein